MSLFSIVDCTLILLDNFSVLLVVNTKSIGVAGGILNLPGVTNPPISSSKCKLISSFTISASFFYYGLLSFNNEIILYIRFFWVIFISLLLILIVFSKLFIRFVAIDKCSAKVLFPKHISNIFIKWFLIYSS